MKFTTATVLALSLALIAATPTPAPTPISTPTPTPGPTGVPKRERGVLWLESGSGTPTVRQEVTEHAGAQLMTKPEPRDSWKLLPGDLVSSDTRPPDRAVELYTGTALAPVLLCRVLVRYFPSKAGWVPNYLVIEEPVVALIDGRWQPVAVPQGTPLLMQIGNTLPNADGFFPKLELGLTTGAYPIIAWQVR